MSDRISIEKTIVGCVLFDENKLDTFTGLGGDATWFSDGQTKEVIELCIERRSKDEPIDLVTIPKILTGIALGWFDSCIDMAITPSEIEGYTMLLRGYEVASRGERMGGALVHRAKNMKPDSTEELLEWINRAVAAVNVGNVHVVKTSDEIQEEIAGELDNPATMKFIDWPLDCLNREIGRVTRQVIWISALASQGKTALALQWCMALAKKGHVAALASLETPKKEVIWRQIAQYGRMDTFALIQGRGSKSEIIKAKAAMKQISPLTIIEDGGKSIEQAKAWGREVHKQGAEILMFDNTRWITVPGADGRVNGTAIISAGMKSLRDELEIPVVVFHHSRIDSNGKEDVSWCTDIHRDTDMLLFLRQNKDKSESAGKFTNYPRFCSELYVDKNRNGPHGMDVQMEFIEKCTLFDKW